ncbi:MAG: hypothetical protein ABIK96_01635 [bacterium]
MRTVPLLLLLAAALGSWAISGCGEDVTEPDSAPGPSTIRTTPVLQAEPAYSPGTSNTVRWGVPEEFSGGEALVQAGTDAEFAGLVAESGWITAESHEFTGLEHGERYHFRVKVRDPEGGESPWSEPVSSIQDAEPPVAGIGDPGPEQTSLRFDVELTASDPISGIASAELWFTPPAATEPELFGTFPPGDVVFLATSGGDHGFLAVAVDSAGNRSAMPQAPQVVTLVPEPIIITDLTGEDFDITNAVLRHNIHQAFWAHGLGRDTIRPVIDPRMVGPGEAGYPDDQNTAEVIGVIVEGDARAYRIVDIPNREVVDDWVGGVPLAATY